MKELIIIQQSLRAPKAHRNEFGGFNYRSAEDILEAVKPLLFEQACILTLTDEIILIGERYYVKATATLQNSEGKEISVSAFAREESQKKGMDAAQITGAASSYARKYALNGLFCIDDTKDPDAQNNTESIKWAKEEIEKRIENAKDIDELKEIWDNISDKQRQELKNLFINRKKQLQ